MFLQCGVLLCDPQQVLVTSCLHTLSHPHDLPQLLPIFPVAKKQAQGPVPGARGEGSEGKAWVFLGHPFDLLPSGGWA